MHSTAHTHIYVCIYSVLMILNKQCLKDVPENTWRRERLPTPVSWPGEVHGL